ncbi:LOW QUALITY PROTEIN: histone-arginine methyltransferase CARM1-like [Rhynochetos jubatus]
MSRAAGNALTGPHGQCLSLRASSSSLRVLVEGTNDVIRRFLFHCENLHFTSGEKSVEHASPLLLADGACVFKSLVNRYTEYCPVGKQSVLITLGYNSTLLQFSSPADRMTMTTLATLSFFFFFSPIVTFDVRLLMAWTVKYTVNVMEAAEADLHRVEIPFVFQIMQSGLIHGLAFWFDMAFVGSLVTVWLRTAATEPLTHWYQVRYLLQTPLFAEEGETLSGKVLSVAIAWKVQNYDIQIVAMVDPRLDFKSDNILDLKDPLLR